MRWLAIWAALAGLGCEAKDPAYEPPPVALVEAAMESGGQVIEARPRTWTKDVQPIVLEHCGPCHVGPSETGCVGGTCLSLYYDAFASWFTCCKEPYIVYQERPDMCPNGGKIQPVWECGMARIYSFESQGKDPLPPEQVRVLEEWIEDGTPR